MAIKRIVTDIATSDMPGLRAFYEDLFDLRTVMDQGWIATLASGTDAPVQLSIAREGGSGTPVPDMSIEVEYIDALYARAMDLGHAVEYPLTQEPWGVRRFYLRDPAGKLMNVMMHSN